jgi:hypothetical protein
VLKKSYAPSRHRRNRLRHNRKSSTCGDVGQAVPPAKDFFSTLLESELKNLLDNPPDSEDWSASVCVPVRPPPHLNSGAIALPEPEEPNL